MTDNFNLFVEKISASKVGVSVVYKSSDELHPSCVAIEPEFKTIVTQFIKLYEINKCVKVAILADTSGSMGCKISGIDVVSLFGITFKLCPEIAVKREGIQIYTLVVLGVILKKIVTIMHQINFPIDLKLEIIPFDSVVRDILKIDILTYQVQEIVDMINNHMTEMCRAKGSTYIDKAIKLFESTIDDTVPTIVIATTDGQFDNFILAKNEWEKLSSHPYVSGGCIGMGKSADSKGVSQLNRGNCLIEGSFDIDDGLDNIIQTLPCVMEDLVRLCSMGDSKKNIPSYVKFSIKSCDNMNSSTNIDIDESISKVVDKNTMDSVFENTLYSAKTYCRFFAIVEGDMERVPNLIMTDNFGVSTEFDLNKMDSNFSFGGFLDLIISSKNIDKFSSSKKEAMNQYNEKLRKNLYRNSCYKNEIDYNKRNIDDVYAYQKYRHNNDSLEQREINQNILKSANDEILDLQNKVAELEVKYTVLLEERLVVLKDFSDEIHSNLIKLCELEKQSNNTSICEVQELLKKTAKMSIALKKAALLKKLFAIFSKQQYNNNNNDCIHLSSAAVTAISSEITSYPSYNKHKQDEDHQQNIFAKKDNKFSFDKCYVCLKKDVCVMSSKCGHMFCCEDKFCNDYLFQGKSRQEYIFTCPRCDQELCCDIDLFSVAKGSNGIKCQGCYQNCNFDLKKDDVKVEDNVKNDINKYDSNEWVIINPYNNPILKNLNCESLTDLTRTNNFANNVLKCGHIGYCNACYDKCKKSDGRVICYECNTDQQILCLFKN
jgi:hypothetical protein